MLAHILTTTGPKPSVVNGAPMLNVLDAEGIAQGWQYASEGPFLCEVDESDGTIANYDPKIGVVLNISEDHKTLNELEDLFRGYLHRSEHCVIGLDSPLSARLAEELDEGSRTTFSLRDDSADFYAEIETRDREGLIGQVRRRGEPVMTLRLPLIGAFNLGNALAALAAAERFGVPLEAASAALLTFKGSARRLQTIQATRRGTVIDDFAHNPDKIAASIDALSHHYPRLTVLYQPHGYGPLHMYRDLYEAAFACSLRAGDRLVVTEPVYFGGTVNRTDDAALMAKGLADRGLDVHYTESRDAAIPLLEGGRPNEAVVVMGARDDGLTTFACELAEHLDTER
jgi:UDP-N-acetylmuramate--alanine ligase